MVLVALLALGGCENSWVREQLHKGESFDPSSHVTTLSVEERISGCESFDCILKAGEEFPSLCHLKAHGRFTRAIVECDATCKVLLAADPEAFDCWRVEACAKDRECAELFGLEPLRDARTATLKALLSNPGASVLSFPMVLNQDKATFEALCRGEARLVESGDPDKRVCVTPQWGGAKITASFYNKGVAESWWVEFSSLEQADIIKQRLTDKLGAPKASGLNSDGCQQANWSPADSSLDFLLAKCDGHAEFMAMFRPGR